MILAALGPKAQATLEDARRLLRASSADRERIEAALRARLGEGALPPDPIEAFHPNPSSWGLWSGVAIGACVLGGTLFFALRPSPRPPTTPPATSATPAPATASIDSGPPQATMSAPAASSAIPLGSGPQQRDRLMREVALLSRATSALRVGRFDDALRALNEHQREFPHGTLSEERRAAKAQVLCSTGHVAQGLAELQRLSPQSPAGLRAKKVCASLGSPAVKTDNR